MNNNQRQNTLNNRSDFLNSELSNLLNLVNSPALIYDRRSDQITHINNEFCKLTGLNDIDLEDLSLKKVLNEEVDTNPINNQRYDVCLINAEGVNERLNLQIFPLNNTNQQVILVFNNEIQTDLRDDLLEQERSYSILRDILTVRNIDKKDLLLSSLIDLIQKIVSAETIGVYTFTNNRLILEEIPKVNASPASFLPISLNMEDLTDLQIPVFWKNNHKTSSNLHELALSAGYKYLISIPLIHTDSWIGMILICGHETPPDDIAFRYLSLVGDTVSDALDAIRLHDNKISNINKLKQVIQIEHTIVDNVEEGVIVLTSDLKIAELNPAAEIILGYNNKEVFKLPIDSILIGTDSLSSAFNSAKQGITTLSSTDLRLHNRNGKSFPAQVITIPVLNDKKVVSIIILLKDTSQSEIVRVRTQQLEQRAFLGEVSAVFAHEVKNPINSIMTGLQFMGMNMDQSSPDFDLVNRLQNDCVRLTHLMDSVLSFSKPVEFNLSNVDLSILLSNLLERWGPRMRRLNIMANYESSAERPLVIGDLRSLEQVFVNLVSNAVQAMEKTGGTLTIKTHELPERASPPQVEITVSDSGPGIPDDIREHIFEPFMTTNQNGTGLGLAISKRIISAHKGNIYVESFTGGTIFHVLLPKSNGDTK